MAELSKGILGHQQPVTSTKGTLHLDDILAMTAEERLF
jgi:hypothetical protein